MNAANVPDDGSHLPQGMVDCCIHCGCIEEFFYTGVFFPNSKMHPEVFRAMCATADVDPREVSFVNVYDAARDPDAPCGAIHIEFVAGCGSGNERLVVIDDEETVAELLYEQQRLTLAANPGMHLREAD